MVTNKKRTISLALVMIMVVAVLAGCTGTPSTTAPSTTEPTTTPVATTTLPEPGEVELPLADPPVTITVYFPMTAEALQVLQTRGDNEGLKELARRTGVMVEWINPVIGQDAETFTLMINSGELPDVLMGGLNYYPGGVPAALEDGIIIDVKDLVDANAPNYRLLRETDEQFKLDSVMDNGKMPGFFTYNVYSEMRPWGGFMIRKDWLDDLNLPIPETYDEWYTTLLAFKEQKGADVPLIMLSSGDYPGNSLSGGFNVGGYPTNSFYQMDGEVTYGPTQPAFKDYLTMLNKWYQEGLIGEDFMTDQNPFYAPDSAKIAGGRSGLFWAAVPLINMYKAIAAATAPEFELAPVLNPVINKGDLPKFNSLGNPDVKGGLGAAITSDCEVPELVAKWCDYQYTDDGYLLSNFGIEGESYEIVDGKPKFLESLLADPNGITKYVYRYGATIYDQDIEFEQLTSDNMKTFYNVWKKAGYAQYLPIVSPTVDEAERHAAIMVDVNTFVLESTINFITGTKPLSEFDAYVESVKSMGIEESIGILQDQYDRYMAR